MTKKTSNRSNWNRSRLSIQLFLLVFTTASVLRISKRQFIDVSENFKFLSQLDDVLRSRVRNYGHAQSSNATLVNILLTNEEEFDDPYLGSYGFVMFASNKSQTPVCVLIGACLTRNGSLAVPIGLRSNLSTLQNCTQERIIFIDSKKELEKYQQLKYDLSGTKIVTAHHIPHFIDDFKSNLMALDVVFEESKRKQYDVCYNSSGLLSSCMSNIPTRSNLQLAHLVPHHFLNMRFSSWIPQFLSRLSKSWFVYSNNSLFLNTTRDGVCFRSMISSRIDWRRHKMRIQKVSPLTSTIEEQIFLNHEKSNADYGPGDPRLRFLLVDRSVRSGRKFRNSKEIIHLIKQLERVCVINGRKIKVSVNVAKFEELSFLDQVRHVEISDIIIAIHGAGLTNVIFANPGTEVIEIVPFMYAASFEHLVREFSLNYFRLISEPDSNHFYQCIANSSISNPDLLPAIISWKKALRVWDSKTTREKYQQVRPHKGSMKDISSFKLRICLRSQMISVDLVALSNILQEAIQSKLSGFGGLHCKL